MLLDGYHESEIWLDIFLQIYFTIQIFVRMDPL